MDLRIISEWSCGIRTARSMAIGSSGALGLNNWENISRKFCIELAIAIARIQHFFLVIVTSPYTNQGRESKQNHYCLLHILVDLPNFISINNC